MSVTFSSYVTDQKIELSNVDAVHIFDLLAIDLQPRLTGELEAAGLALKCIDWLLLLEAVPELERVWWNENYLCQRLIELRDLAQAAGCYPIYYA